MQQGDRLGARWVELYMARPVERINEYIARRGWQRRCRSREKPVLEQRCENQEERWIDFTGDE
eukprot:8708908-Lingulodinium_polyedra.AAC.1